MLHRLSNPATSNQQPDRYHGNNLGIRIRAVVREHGRLEGAAVEPTLEEAYLAMASEGEVRAATFSFLGAGAV